MATYAQIFEEMRRKSRSELRSYVDHFAAVALSGVRANVNWSNKEIYNTILVTLLSAICADGYFNGDEYYVAQPALNAFLWEGITYEETLSCIRNARIDTPETRTNVDRFVDAMDADTKDALIFATAAICAADSSFNSAELSWLNRLIG